MVKYCIYYKKNYYTIHECYVKYFHLILTSRLHKSITKRRQGAENINKKFDEAKENETAYFAINKLISFIIINSLTNFYTLNIYMILQFIMPCLPRSRDCIYLRHYTKSIDHFYLSTYSYWLTSWYNEHHLSIVENWLSYIALMRSALGIFLPFISLFISYRNVIWVKSKTSSNDAWAYPTLR